jgi:hypothetical protein
MADLLDIAPSAAVESVKVGDRFIVVRGLRGNAIASILARFPGLAALLDGNIDEFGPRLIAQFGNAFGAIIAAGCDHLEDKTYEQYASETLLFEDQVKLITTIIRLTFPKGAGSFVAVATAINTMAVSLTGAGEETKPVKMRLKQSPSTSQPSSAEDSPQILQ